MKLKEFRACVCVHRIAKLPRGSLTALTRTELTSVQCWCVNCSIHKCFVFLILKRRHFHRAFWPCEPAKCAQSATSQATMTSSAGLTSLPLGLTRLGWTHTESALVWISPPPTQAAELLSNYIVDSRNLFPMIVPEAIGQNRRPRTPQHMRMLKLFFFAPPQFA